MMTGRERRTYGLSWKEGMKHSGMGTKRQEPFFNGKSNLIAILTMIHDSFSDTGSGDGICLTTHKASVPISTHLREEEATTQHHNEETPAVWSTSFTSLLPIAGIEHPSRSTASSHEGNRSVYRSQDMSILCPKIRNKGPLSFAIRQADMKDRRMRKTREDRLEEIGNSSCMSFHVIYLNRKEKGQIASLRCVRKKKKQSPSPYNQLKLWTPSKPSCSHAFAFIP